MPFPFIFTFYSFKGGVGRSLALLNAAYALAGRGRHVLVADVDLEAPGISGFLLRNQELGATPLAHAPDILSFLSEAVSVSRSTGHGTGEAGRLPPVSNYIRPVAPEKLKALRPRFGQPGRLDVLGIDIERDYPARLADLGLKDLSPEELRNLSRLLHRYFKDQRFPHRPLGIEPFEEPLATPYDYVLVDSRTGITEIGGLCVGPLADRLVVLTGLNDQNVHGTLSFLNEVGIQPRPRPQEDEPWDEADAVSAGEQSGKTLGPKPTIVVASPVPSGEIQFKRERLKTLETLLGVRPISLSYHPQIALLESVFVRDYPEEYLAGEYHRLATHLMAQVRDDPQSLIQQSQVLRDQKKEPAAAVQCGLRLASHEPDLGAALLRQLANAAGPPPDDPGFRAIRRLHAYLAEIPEIRHEALNNWGSALSEQAQTKSGEEADRLFEESYGKFAEALRLKPDLHDILINWGTALSEQAQTKSGEEADRLFEEAYGKFAEALRLKPDECEVLVNWATALSDQATAKRGEEADRLFEESYGKFAEALRLKPDLHDILINWGTALSEQAQTKSGEEADRLFEEAYGKFAEALRLKPDLHEALYNWGTMLWEQAQTKRGEEADRLFEEAYGKFAGALRLKPDEHDILINWATGLSDQATTKRGEEADRLFEEAYGKFAEALRLKPDLHDILINWGTALFEQAKRKSGEEADRLFEEAYGKFAEALRLKPDEHDILINWGTALFEQAKRKSGEEADLYLREARQKYFEAERIRTGTAAFKLACLEAWRGHTSEALRWLKTLQSSGARLFSTTIAAESSFDRVRSDPDFAAFVEGLDDGRSGATA